MKNLEVNLRENKKKEVIYNCLHNNVAFNNGGIPISGKNYILKYIISNDK